MDAFEKLEKLAAVSDKKKRVYTPEQKAKKADRQRKRAANNPEKVLEENSRWRDANRWRVRETERNRFENKSDFELFAINQAAKYAFTGEVTRDITANCPEPQRSQLQALVDRIKADPQAGKAVVGLLRTMRELRKAELAEMKSGVDA